MKKNIDQMSVEDLKIHAYDLTMQLIIADKLAMAVDEAVSRNIIDSRCSIADARLSYGEPYTYAFWSERPPVNQNKAREILPRREKSASIIIELINGSVAGAFSSEPRRIILVDYDDEATPASVEIITDKLDQMSAETKTLALNAVERSR